MTGQLGRSQSRMPTLIPERIEQLLADVGELPALPDVPLRVLKMAGDDTLPIGEISAVIQRDPALTINILRVSNSAYYGVRQRVSSLTMAMTLLGLNEIVNLVVGVAIISMFGGPGRERQLPGRAFWRHSLGTAVASKMLVEHFRFDGYEDAFVAGLIHDIGVLICSQYLPGQFRQVLDVMEHTGQGMAHAEQEVMGTSHAEIGAWAAQHWQLPPLLVEALRFHHTPLDALAQAAASERPALAAIVHLADRVAAEDALPFLESQEDQEPLDEDVAWNIILAENPKNTRDEVREYAAAFNDHRPKLDMLMAALS